MKLFLEVSWQVGNSLHWILCFPYIGCGIKKNYKVHYLTKAQKIRDLLLSIKEHQAILRSNHMVRSRQPWQTDKLMPLRKGKQKNVHGTDKEKIFTTTLSSSRKADNHSRFVCWSSAFLKSSSLQQLSFSKWQNDVSGFQQQSSCMSHYSLAAELSRNLLSNHNIYICYSRQCNDRTAKPAIYEIMIFVSSYDLFWVVITVSDENIGGTICLRELHLWDTKYSLPITYQSLDISPDSDHRRICCMDRD